MKLQWHYRLQSFLDVATKRRPEMTLYLNNGYDIMNYFAKFEKFLPHSTIIPSFMTVGSQVPELDWAEGGFVWLKMTKIRVYIFLSWHITEKI